jgi:hypothetical protein
MHASVHCAPIRNRAGRTTLRRSSRGRWQGFNFDAYMGTAVAIGLYSMSKALLRNGFSPAQSTGVLAPDDCRETALTSMALPVKGTPEAVRRLPSSTKQIGIR